MSTLFNLKCVNDGLIWNSSIKFIISIFCSTLTRAQSVPNLMTFQSVLFDDSGNLVIEIDDVKDEEEIHVQILASGTIMEVDES